MFISFAEGVKINLIIKANTNEANNLSTTDYMLSINKWDTLYYYN